MARFSRISILPAVVAASMALPASAIAAPASAPKLVHYRGYAITVPAAWPVYLLSTDPSVCVRFDRHAVYLGSPSPSQRCPAHAAGRTEAILISPLAARAAQAGATAAGAALPTVRAAGAQRALGASARLVMSSPGISVTASWGSDPAVIERALRIGWRRLLRAAQSTAARGSRALLHLAAAGAIGAGRRRAFARSAAARSRGSGGAVFTGLGFDACSAPSTSQMTAWGTSPYRAVGIYIGGTNMACAQPNLTSAWVSAEASAGWYLVPIYVGLQAPSSACGCSTIAPKQAASEGTAAALDAIAQAQAIGVGPGSPIYFDMEAYNPGGKTTKAVLTFLAAWTAQLHADGYVSGVYSSGASGVKDLAAAYGTSYLEPDDIWVADWNYAKTASDPYVPAADWPNHQRLHQYSGGHNETYSHVTINIDGNYVDGQTAAAWTPPPDGTFVQLLGAPLVYRLAGGAPLYVNDWASVGGPQSAAVLTAQQFSALRPFPLGGTYLQTSTGGLYIVAGGAPLWISNPSLFDVFGLTPTYIAIDQWDIDNIGNPLVRLRPLPANGTWLTTPTGQIYRVAGGFPFPIASWTPYGGPQPSVTIDPWDIQNLNSPLAHLLAAPVDGTVVEGLPSATYWMFKGARRVQLGRTRGAVRVDDASLTSFSILPGCLVPRLQHLTLGQARWRLRRSHCKLGKVARRTGAAHALRVIRQWPRPRTRHLPGYMVKVTLG
jgi:Domain of unknown function (DUF1906)